jgi:rhomboid protease GluP
MALFNRNEIKMCQSCRALIPANAARCEMCGAEGHYSARAREDEAAFGMFASWPVTTFLLTANVLIYALTLLYQMRLLAQLEIGQGFELSPRPFANDGFGTSQPEIFQSGEGWRLIASCFLHGSPIHLLFNSMALIQAGRIAEEAFGRAQYICLYLLSGVGGNLLAIWLGSRVVGASGALFGLIAALAIYGYRRGDMLGRNLRQDMVYWLLYGLAISLFPGISMLAHAGGALVGAALALALRDLEQLRQSFLRMRAAQVAALLAWALIAGTGVQMARNVMRQNEALRVQLAAERVYTIWLSHLQLNRLLAGAVKKVSGDAELPGLADFAERIDKTYKALCSDVGALERLPVTDEQSGQLYRRIAANLRARCDQPWPMPKADEPGSFAAFKQRNEQGRELDQLLQEYEQWLERKAIMLRRPVDSLKPEIKTEAAPRNRRE